MVILSAEHQSLISTEHMTTYQLRPNLRNVIPTLSLAVKKCATDESLRYLRFLCYVSGAGLACVPISLLISSAESDDRSDKLASVKKDGNRSQKESRLAVICITLYANMLIRPLR